MNEKKKKELNNKYRKECLKMWKWISEQESGTVKGEYFKTYQIPFSKIPKNLCYACEYITKTKEGHGCKCCPITWMNCGTCLSYNSFYVDWRDNKTPKTAKAFYLYVKENWKEV